MIRVKKPNRDSSSDQDPRPRPSKPRASRPRTSRRRPSDPCDYIPQLKPRFSRRVATIFAPRSRGTKIVARFVALSHAQAGQLATEALPAQSQNVVQDSGAEDVQLAAETLSAKPQQWQHGSSVTSRQRCGSECSHCLANTVHEAVFGCPNASSSIGSAASVPDASACEHVKPARVPHVTMDSNVAEHQSTSCSCSSSSS